MQPAQLTATLAPSRKSYKPVDARKPFFPNKFWEHTFGIEVADCYHEICADPPALGAVVTKGFLQAQTAQPANVLDRQTHSFALITQPPLKCVRFLA